MNCNRKPISHLLFDVILIQLTQAAVRNEPLGGNNNYISKHLTLTPEYYVIRNKYERTSTI